MIRIHKKFFWFVVLALTAPTLASAGIIASDNFDSYAPGNLARQGGVGYGWASNWLAGAAGSVTATNTATTIFSIPAGGAMIGGGNSVEIAGTGTGVPVTRPLSSAQTNTFYLGFLLKLAGNPNTGDTYSLALDNSPSDTANGFNCGIYGLPTGGQTYYFIRRGTGTPPSGPLASASGGITDTRYLVLKVEKTGAGNFNKVTGWINPGTNSEAADPNGDIQLVTDLGLNAISYVNLRMQGLDTGDKAWFDSLALAQTFSELMSPAAPGPDERPIVPLIQVESAPNGSANTPVAAQTNASGLSITNYAIVRAANGSFVSNTPAVWSFTESTGGILNRDLVVSADGRSAVFKGNGSGTARILATGNASNLVASGVITVTPRTNAYARPFVWSRLTERDTVLAKIRTAGWATAQFIQMEDRADAAVAANRNNYLRALPLDTSTGVPKFTQTTTSATDGTVVQRFNVGVDCAAMYFLTGDGKYAQCGADILHNAIQGLVNVPPTGNGWIFLDGLLGEGPAVGTQLPVIYDFLYDFLKGTNKVFQLQVTGGTNVAFNFTNAQTVFRTYYQLMRDNSQAGNNWSANMAGCLVHNVLALDDSLERSNSLATYLTTDAPNFSSLKTMAAKYVNPGDIWPEPLSYSDDVNTAHAHLMTVLEHYDPALNLYDAYPNVLQSLPRPFQFINPNGVQIHFGDFHFDTGYDIPYFEYEMVYRHASERNLPELRAQYGALINAAVAQLNYQRSSQVPAAMQNAQPLFWYADIVPEAAVPLEIPRSDTLAYAGVALQRNFPANNNVNNALMYFVCGGGSYVHQHAHGMNMELYGKGVVLGAEGGKGTYGSALHEDYYRVAAAHNSVIVNGATSGAGGWGGLNMDPVLVAAMEPAPFQTGVSSNLSFTCTTFNDIAGTLAEGTEQRTLAIVRTSPTTGYYVDIYRSRSTVTNRVATTLNGNVTNQFHDYVYHNLGDSLDLTTNGVPLPLVSQPSRFQTDIGDTYQQPGWRYFTGTKVSYPHRQPVWAQFKTINLSAVTYMDLHLPAVTNREYAVVSAPPVLSAPAPYDSTNVPTLVVRQLGEAWNRPFAVVFEPHTGNTNSGTVQNVTTLEQNGVVVGLQIDSTVSGKNIVQYVLSNTNATGTYSNAALGIIFTGRFAVVTDYGTNAGSLYLGDGSSLKYGALQVVSRGGTNMQAEVQYVAGQPTVVTANSPVDVFVGSPPTLTSIADQTIPLNSTTGPLAFTLADADTPVASLQLGVTSSNTTLVPTNQIVLGGSGTNRTVTVTPAAMEIGTSAIIISVSDGTNLVSETFNVTVSETAFGRFAFLFNQDGNFEGWTNNSLITNSLVAGGTLTGTLVGNDPQFSRSGLSFAGTNVPVVLVRLKSAAGGNAQLFWGNEQGGPSAARSTTFAVPAGTNFAWYALNVAANTNWPGHTINALRFDPPGTTGTVSADAIIGSDGYFANDSIPDLWKVAYQLDPSVAISAQQDTDGDGLPDLSEYILGTSPVVTNRGLLLAPGISGTNFTLTFVASQATGPGYAGLRRIFDTETKTNLTGPSAWIGLAGFTNITGTNQTVIVTQQPSSNFRFYRVKVFLEP